MPGGHAGQDVPGQFQPPRAEPVIVTLGLHIDDQARFDRLRIRHFPPERNVIAAHVTLFHHLPGTELASVEATVQQACAAQAGFAVAVSGLRPLGRGVAFVLQSTELASLRASLAGIWASWLTPQDRQGFRPHVTIQNKVGPAEAKSLLQAMQAVFQPFTVRATSVLLWRYKGGPWEPAGGYAFGPGAGAPASTPPSITIV